MVRLEHMNVRISVKIRSIEIYITLNFPLRITFNASSRFWKVVFSYSFVFRHFLISSLTHQFFYFWGFFCIMFSLLEFVLFPFFFLIHTIMVRKTAWYKFYSFKFVQACFVTWYVMYPGKHPIELVKDVYSSFFAYGIL